MKFHSDLIEALIAANIPIFKLENRLLKKFLQSYTGNSIKSQTFYRETILDLCYNNKLNTIKNFFNEADSLYIIFDETTDVCSRYILNILIGKCSDSKRERPYLIGTVELTKTNASNVNFQIFNTLNHFFDQDTSKYQRIKLLLTDAAPYAIKAGKLLRELIPELKHVTCLCHALHNLCETIRNANSKVNDFVIFLKQTLLKNKENQRLFLSETGLTIPSWPVPTRWGTWINFCHWLFSNFTSIEIFCKQLVKNIPSEKNISFQKLINEEEFERQLRQVNKFTILAKSISDLESETLSTEGQIGIIAKTIEFLEQDLIYSQRFQEIIQRNPDFVWFKNFSILKCKQNEKIFSFVPLTTVEVERSFSKFRELLSDKRQSMSNLNIEKHLFLYFNSGIE